LPKEIARLSSGATEGLSGGAGSGRRPLGYCFARNQNQVYENPTSWWNHPSHPVKAPKDKQYPSLMGAE